MAGRAEDDALPRVARVGPQRVVGGDELRNIHQDGGISRLSGGGIYLHSSPDLATVACRTRGYQINRGLVGSDLAWVEGILVSLFRTSVQTVRRVPFNNSDAILSI